MSDFIAMTEIKPVVEWPPWPDQNGQLRLNETRKKMIEADFAQDFGLANWPFLRVCHGQYLWAFGTNPTGQEHIETLRGNRFGTIPRQGWQGIQIVAATARRFPSSVVMATMCEGPSFRNLQDESKLPTKGCLGKGGTCHFQSEAIFIELYDPLNPEHQIPGEHKYRECPECFRLGDRCSKLAGESREMLNSNRRGVPNRDGPRNADAWMQGRRFTATEGGLETTFMFENIEVRVLCYPDVFALEKPVWELGQKAQERRNNRSLFDTAFKLLNDRTAGDQPDQPDSLAHVLLLLSHATKPTPTNLWKQTAAVNAAISAEVFNVLSQVVASDVERHRQHFVQKNAIAQVLQDQFQISAQPRTGDPHGWKTFSLKKPREWNNHEVDECYHGTSMNTLAPILLEGLKRPSPGRVAHGQAGSQSRATIYLSPSWHYSAHPVYSPLHVIGFDAFQMVLKCEVIKHQYTKQNGTLANKHWPRDLRIDPDRPTMEDMEYLVEEEGVVRLKEVMFRKFGRNADPNIYGELPPKLHVDCERDALQYQWTDIVQSDFRARGLLLGAFADA